MNCAYQPQKERIALWESAHGAIPLGNRLGWTCRVPYCRNPEHWCLAVDKNFGHQKVAHIVRALEAKKIGEYIEITPPENIAKFRNAIYCGNHRLHIVTRMMPSGLLRLINNGEHCVRDYGLTRETYRKYPQLVFKGQPRSIRREWTPPAFVVIYNRCRMKACPYPHLTDGLCKKHLAERQWESSPVGSSIALFKDIWS